MEADKVVDTAEGVPELCCHTVAVRNNISGLLVEKAIDFKKQAAGTTLLCLIKSKPDEPDPM